MSTISIAVSGMQAASAQLLASASNIANMSTTGAVPVASGSTGGTVYQPISVNQFTAPGGQPNGVAYSISQNADGYFQTYDPSSPNANADGMIAVPNVDVATEMINAMRASADYAANAKIVKAADDMQKAALDLIA